MSYIKTLTINGKTYTIRDPEAVRGEQLQKTAVLCQTQEFSEDEKKQARQNIGALSQEDMGAYVDESILGGAW